MASLKTPRLVFDGGCPDCGRREIDLPQPLPLVGDDFDWFTRDFDGFRIHMLEDLAARFPERERWTRADLEVVLVEALAAALDQLSDMTDRVFAECYLETARQPESVLKLLKLLGFDPSQGLDDDGGRSRTALLQAWREDPRRMEAARNEGKLRLFDQERIVTLDDFSLRLQEHPFVERASAARRWGGSWWIVQVAVSLFDDIGLDDERSLPDSLKRDIDGFNATRGLLPVAWATASRGDPSARTVLQPYIEACRMLGQPVELRAVTPVGISMSISLRLDDDYFKSEVERTVREVLGRGPGRFFEPGRLKFGESLFVSDIYQVLSNVEGIVDVAVTQFKRVGARFADQSASGVIRLNGLELARCDNAPASPEYGSFRLVLHGGRGG